MGITDRSALIYPVDYRQAGWVIQIDALDLLHGFMTETLRFRWR